jgi:uncharacterized phage protein (TIGR01671 family)
MNRELKFRIWDKQSKTWLQNGSSLHCYSNWTICPFTSKLVDYVGTFGEDDRCIPSPAEDYYFEGTKLIQEPRYVIQQYTGLKDSKGVEIYEGDIVKIGDRKKEVIFNLGMFYIDENYGDFVPVSEVDNIIEVIGNVLENKELIKNNDNNNQ